MGHPSNRARDERGRHIRTLHDAIGKLMAELEAENAKPEVDLERVAELGKRIRRFQNTVDRMKPKARKEDGRRQQVKERKKADYTLPPDRMAGKHWLDDKTIVLDEHRALMIAQERGVHPDDKEGMARIRAEIATEHAQRDARLERWYQTPDYQTYLARRFPNCLPPDDDIQGNMETTT
jgi:hypothetical protein